MPKNIALLTSKSASEILGVHESSVKRWSNLGELPFHSTVGGHRRFAWEDLLRYANQHNISHAYADFETRALGVYAAKENYQKQLTLTSFGDLIREWMEEGHLTSLHFLLVFMVEQLKIPFVKIADELIFPSMVLIGQWWEEGKIDTAQEHRLSQEWNHALNVLRHKKNRLCPPKFLTGRLAILACSDENTHELALHCLRILLEERDFGVIFLGARVPDHQLKACIEREKPALVAVSFSPLDGPQDIQRSYQTLSKVDPQHQAFDLAFGGGRVRHDSKDGISPSPPMARFGHFKSLQDFCQWLELGKS